MATQSEYEALSRYTRFPTMGNHYTEHVTKTGEVIYRLEPSRRCVFCSCSDDDHSTTLASRECLACDKCPSFYDGKPAPTTAAAATNALLARRAVATLTYSIISYGVLILLGFDFGF